MTTLRIALRVARGGGVAGAIRLSLMSVGIAVGVAAALFVVMVPLVLNEQARLDTARAVDRSYEGDEHALLARQALGSWGGHRLTRVFVAEVTPDTPLPPGIERLPAGGEVVLSPAAARLRAEERAFAQLVPGNVAGEIGPAGLLGPDELYAYIGVRDPGLVPTLSPVRGWGGAGRADAETADRFASVPAQLAVLVLAPALIYLVICARLSSATRRTRYAALRLIGMRRRAVLRIAAYESAFAGIVGAVLGIGLYTAANGMIGPSGLLGFTWYPAASAIGPAGAAVVVLAVGFAGAMLGRAGTRRVLSRPLEARTDLAERPARWWLAIPLVLGLGLLVTPLLRPWSAAVTSSEVGLILAGCVLTGTGVLLALRPLLVGGARLLAMDRLPAPVRLAARRIEHEPAGVIRVLAGLVALVLVAGIGAAVVEQTRHAAGAGGGDELVRIDAGEIPVGVRDEVFALPARSRWSVQPSVLEQPAVGEGSGGSGEGFGASGGAAQDGPDGPGVVESDPSDPESLDTYVRTRGVDLVVATCAQVTELTGAAPPGCRNGRRYRVVDPAGSGPELPPGYPLRYHGPGDEEFTVAAPSREWRLPAGIPGGPGFGGGPTLLVIGTESPVGWSSDALYFFRLDPGIVALDRFATELAALTPAAMVHGGPNIAMLEQYRTHRSTIRSGVAVGFLLGVLAFLIAAVDRALERRRQVAALVVLGARRRTVRVVQALTLLTPLALSLAAAALVAHLAGNALLRLDTEQEGWFAGTLTGSVPYVAGGLLLAAAVSWITVGARLRPTDLRRE